MVALTHSGLVMPYGFENLSGSPLVQEIVAKQAMGFQLPLTVRHYLDVEITSPSEGPITLRIFSSFTFNENLIFLSSKWYWSDHN